MYSYISGSLEEVNETTVVVDNHGIGYNIFVPATVIQTLPPIGAEVKIYTFTYVKEDQFSLFGFSTRDALQMFRMLLGVSGVGPKAALAVLSVLSADDLRFAILSDDVKAIEKAQGVGKKVAQKIILELKDKVDLEDAFEKKLANETEVDALSQVRDDAVQALVSLGYSSTDAFRVVRELDLKEDATVEDALKDALKKMAFI